MKNSIAIVLLSGILLFPRYVSGNDVTISEFMTINSGTIIDEDGDFSDWIEIYNSTAEPVDLLGWSLTDDASLLTKWKFPQVNIQANSYLIVFASGKNRLNSDSELHTNFKLLGSGEYLALIMPDGITITSAYSPVFPVQYEDISYGKLNNSDVYFKTPTPSGSNADDEFLPPPVFSILRGFFYSPFTVQLLSPISNTSIYYTTDGSAPDTSNGLEYSAPISIGTTTILRAIAFKDDSITSEIISNSYIFPDDVKSQTNTPAGYPATWGEYFDFEGTSTADYRMDPEITTNESYANLIKTSLLSVPVISLSTNKDNIFSHSTDTLTGGIYIYTGPYNSFGSGWERPVSFEYIDTETDESLQVNCGIRIQGGASRQAEKNPKHSFRLVFRGEYGPGKLNLPLFGDSAAKKFNTIVLRAAYGNSWRHFDPNQRARAQHIRDPWAKDTQRDMGHHSANNKFAHVFLNGMYWGLYNISERIDNDYMQSYLGGDEEEYDIIKDYGELVDGNLTAWNYLWTAVSNNISDNAKYQQLIGNNSDGTPNSSFQPYLDATNLADYMILNFYGGNNDWDHHNWVAARNRVNPEKGFQFFCWDTEKILENINENYTNENNANRPSGIFTYLMTNGEFKILFADRATLHLTNNGELTPGPVIDRWMKRADEIDTAMIAESARWGDYRRDVHPWSYAPFDLYTYRDHWLVEQARLINNYFPSRTQIVIDQLKTAGFLGDLDAPEFSQQGGTVHENFKLNMTSDQGNIYYTLDETDPRLTGGSIHPNAILFTDSVEIEEETTVKARAIDGTEWSPLAFATFYYESEFSGIETSIASIENVTVFPNPFNDFTIVKYTIPFRGKIDISVYSIEGKLIKTLSSGIQNTGAHFVIWQPENIQPGLYFIRLSYGKTSIYRKLIFSK